MPIAILLETLRCTHQICSKTQRETAGIGMTELREQGDEPPVLSRCPEDLRHTTPPPPVHKYYRQFFLCRINFVGIARKFGRVSAQCETM